MTLVLQPSARYRPGSVTVSCNPGPEGRRQRAEGATREEALALKKIRLELGRTPDFPEGSFSHGYEFVVPLTEDGQIDLKAWEAEQQKCTVLRFWGTAELEHGELIRLPEGGWAFSYAPGEEDDEPIYRLVDHTFKEGEYVSITEHDGVTRAFKVVQASDWRPEA